MKIFVNAYLEQNLGDDLFFYILKNRYPQHTFYVLSTFWNNESNVKVYRNPIYNKIIKKYKFPKTKVWGLEAVKELDKLVFHKKYNHNIASLKDAYIIQNYIDNILKETR